MPQRPPSQPQRSDPAAHVKAGNKKMRDAWQRGRDMVKQVGMRASYRGMQAAAGGDIPRAERLRKLRGMANRITETELETICNLCTTERRAWGPAFLIALSRLEKSRDRRKVAQQAIQERWGLVEMHRRIRLRVGPRRDATLVGRRRQLNWADEAVVLHEIELLTTVWIRFAADMETSSGAPDGPRGPVLPKGLRERFQRVVEMVEGLRRRVHNRQKRIRS